RRREPRCRVVGGVHLSFFVTGSLPGRNTPGAQTRWAPRGVGLRRSPAAAAPARAPLSPLPFGGSRDLRRCRAAADTRTLSATRDAKWPRAHARGRRDAQHAPELPSIAHDRESARRAGGGEARSSVPGVRDPPRGVHVRHPHIPYPGVIRLGFPLVVPLHTFV